jgi:ATP-dependent Clp protease protease subunit
MSKVLVYKNMQALVRNRPIALPRRKRRSRKKSIVWMRDLPLLDRGLELARRPKIESMVACFDPPADVKVENPFPEQFFVPGRTIFMAGMITSEVAKIVKENISKKAEEDPNKPIILWINSPGGEVEAGLKIKEAMEAVRPKVSTIAIGGVSSMAAFLAAFGSKGYRYILKDTILMYHEVRYSSKMVLGSDAMEKAAQELVTSTENLFTLLASASGNRLKDIQGRFSGKDVYFSSEDAVRAGFLDGVIEPVRYYGPANPWGWKIVSYRSPLQRTSKKIIELKDKIESESEEAPKITLSGMLDAMDSYKIIGRLVSHIALDPKRDVKLAIKNSPGGFVEEAMGVFDVMRMINALPNCGDVMTSGSGSSIEGTSALLLAGGKKGKRKIDPVTELILNDILMSAPAHAPASRVEELSEEINRFEKMIMRRFDGHSNLSAEAIRERIAAAQKEEEDGFSMDADAALKYRFVDKVSD